MKTFVPLVLLAIIIGSGVYMASYYREQPAPGEPVATLAPVACEACGKAYKTMLGAQPAKCHFCGEQAVWRAKQCVQCNAIVPVTGGFSHEEGPPLKCPKCGASRFKEVSPNDVEEP